MDNTFAKADEVQLKETLDDVSCSSSSTLSEFHRNLDASEAKSPFGQDGFNDLFNDSDEIKEKNSSEYQNLLTPEQNTTETSIELRLAEVDSDDGLSFFLSLLCGFDREDVVPARTLRNNVANHILESRYIKIDNILCEINRETLETYSDKVKQGTILGVPTVLHALASLYPKYLFCTISKTSRTDGRISINVATYVKDISSYKKCVFIFYDGMIDHYNAVFLYNKTNEEEEKSNFKYDNNTMKILLTKFIKEKLKYDNYVNSEDTQVNVEADITVNGFMEHDYIYDSIAHRDVADTEKSLGKYANSWMSNATRTLPSSISNINPDNLISIQASTGAREIIQKFVRKDAFGGGDCLFSSLCNVLGIADKITIKDLRKKAADFNRQPGKIDKDWLLNTTGKTVEQYCDEMENTTAWGGEPEIRAIAELYKIIIRVVNVNSEKFCVSASEFPPNQTSFDRCCYIILNNNHYESLHLRTDNNSNDERSIFDSNDEEIKKLILNSQSLTHSRHIPSSDIIYELDQNNSSPDSIEQFLQTDFSRYLGCFSEQQMELQQIEDSSTANISPGDTTISYKLQNQQKIRLEIEPVKKFKFRYESDIVPQKEYNHNGARAKRGRPTYFANRNDENKKNARHSLTLLVPTTLVFGKNPVALDRIKALSGCHKG
ncbi:unnamed protein product [Rotaria sp. Silwood1]|nr:unnamed protein product [Rotaria sp. Silwood1]CAF0945933.1 unnamed protein product [Rotaria sp. Silwood1]